MSETVIEVQHLCSSYGRSLALDDISFTVNRGEIFTIIGRSGCGKTTLLKNLLGLMHYSQGSARVLGIEVSDEDAVEREKLRRRMGVLFQRGALLNAMNVGENVGLPLEMFTDKTREEIEAEVREALAAVGLAHAFAKFPTELSGGMVKRAALARAMIMRPEILFCDEPSAGLDPVTTKGIDELLLELKSRFQITVVVVTHDLLSIERIADRVIMIQDHKLAFNGAAGEIKTTENGAVREFFLHPEPL
jgi:phospholipid/cholesterol/gamma-HCH transport system ATP-binding protein